MTFKTTKLRDAISFAIAVGATAIVGTGAAFAQSGAPPIADSTTTSDLDRIEVTGSRIRQVDIETAAPVLLISRTEIEKQGFSSVADILQNISAVGSPAISRTSPLSSGEEVGGQFIDLRNLGPNRTLILVNGKRLGISNGGLQDVASIPANSVERIEVLKDGASTLYGSDAIAGVINIITRKNFEGAEANAYLGQYSQGDGFTQIYDFLLGFKGDKGSVTAGFEYTKQDPVWMRDRWFAIDRYPTQEGLGPRPGGRSGTTQFGRFSYRGAPDPVTGVRPSINRTLNRDVAGLDPRNLASYRNSAGDTSNPAEQSTVYTGIERKSIFVNGNYDIADWLNFETDLLYTDRDSFAQNGGYPYQSGNFGTPMSVDSYFNPVGNQASGPLPAGVLPQGINFVRRGWEVPRQVQNGLTTFRFTGEFSGAFALGENMWDWNAGYMYQQNKGVQISTGNLNTQAVALAVGPSFLNNSGVVQCGTAADPIPLGVGGGTCTPWNPLIPFGYPGANTASDPNVKAFLYLPGQALSETQTTNYFANVTGTLAKLPAGDLGLAVGYEYRREEGTFSPDGLAQTGISTDLAGGPTAGSYNLNEVYAELQVPILADLPGAQELSVNLASRYSDYNTFGDTVNSKFGFTWKPIDQLLVRGTWSQGFRAPAISDLYGGSSQTFDDVTDPCDTVYGNAGGTARCLQDVPPGYRQPNGSNTGPTTGPTDQTFTPFLSGSNPDLTPETSKSKTLGLVWSPTFAEGLGLSLDWWKIRIDNVISGDTVNAALNDCYVRGIESRCNAATGTTFARDPVTGAITTGFRSLVNLGWIETEGYDFDINYRLPTDYGNFGINSTTTYVSKYETKADQNSDKPPSQSNGFGGFFRVRSNLGLTWDMGDWGASWAFRYYSSTKENCSFTLENDGPELARCSIPEFQAPETQGLVTPLTRLGSVTFQDVQLRWTAPWNATVAVGANNVFGRYGPVAYDQPNSGVSYYGGYDIGRFIYMKYQQRF